MARRDSAPRRFAEAAFEIALRDETVEDWREQLDRAAAALDSADLGETLANPALPLQQRVDIVSGVFADLSDPVRNLILLLLRRGRIRQLPRVAAELRRLDDKRNNVVHAIATSASPLEDAEIVAITARLEQMSGNQVALETAVDPDLIGGVVVRIGDRLIDGSVRGRLERLRNQLAAGTI
ncbi:MAG TPA: ATP synthase F1 subunit delta [Candidatus Limnocylindrales bacterium]|nr:ATP synthase F1 subunit delta [Candidatus Limnocylindrales bacterium]